MLTYPLPDPHPIKCQVAADILGTLRRNLPSHVTLTCKIRLLDNQETTIETCRRLAAAGAEAISVHGRGIFQPPTAPPRWAEIGEVATALSHIPVLVNGSIWDVDKVRLARKTAGVGGVMIGRGSLRDMAVFAREGQGEGEAVRSAQEVLTRQVEEYAKIAVDVENAALNTRFILQWMFHEAGILFSDPRALALETATTLADIAVAVGIEEHYHMVDRGEPLPATHYYADSRGYFQATPISPSLTLTPTLTLTLISFQITLTLTLDHWGCLFC